MATDLMTLKNEVKGISDALTAWDTSRLATLVDKAGENLERMLADGQPLAEDSELALKAYNTIADLQIKSIEAKRRMIDTLVKAKSIMDSGAPLVDFPIQAVKDPDSGQPVDDSSLSFASIKDGTSAI